MTGTCAIPQPSRPSPGTEPAAASAQLPDPDAATPEGPVRRSSHQAAIIAAGRIGAAVLSALWLVVAARSLTLSQFSDVALVLALGSTFFFLSDAGYSTLLSSHVASVGAIQPAAVVQAVRRRVTGCALATVVLVVAYLVAADDTSVTIPLLFAGSLVGNAVHGSITAALRSVGQVTVEAANEILSRVLVLAVGWTWLSNGGGVRAAVLVYVLGDVVSSVGMVLYARRWTRANPSPAAPLPDLGWRRAVPISVGSGFATIYGRLDTWLVALLAPTGAAGLYAACYRIVEALRLPAQSVGAVTLVDAAKVPGAQGATLARGRALRLAALTALPGLVLLVAAEPILRVTFGAPFGAAAGTLRILALSAVGSAVVSVLGPTASVRSGTRFAIAVGAVTVLNALANVVLVPALGGAGAAWANVASEAALAGLLAAAVAGGQGRVKT